jgi:hypothetical protein
MGTGHGGLSLIQTSPATSSGTLQSSHLFSVVEAVLPLGHVEDHGMGMKLRRRVAIDGPRGIVLEGASERCQPPPPRYILTEDSVRSGKIVTLWSLACHIRPAHTRSVSAQQVGGGPRR